jgi:hypothetical protein
MNLLKKLFGQKDQAAAKTQFLAGWEVTFDNGDTCERFMQTQGIDEKTATTIWSAIKLSYAGEKLVAAEDYREGEPSPREMTADEWNLPYREIPVHPIHALMPAPAGAHRLGGDIPHGFTIPKDAQVPVSFQYLGYIDPKDPVFSWLPFTLHLTCPIFLNFEKVFLDYSDPLAPIVLNGDELADTDSSFDELSQDSVIIYESLAFDTQPAIGYGDGIGHSGVPSWIQWPDIPRCPKTNKIMRFLCQFNMNVQVKASYHNVTPSEDYHLPYFEQMNFWSDGDLFIFFEPDSKTCCYIIQNT